MLCVACQALIENRIGDELGADGRREGGEGQSWEAAFVLPAASSRPARAEGAVLVPHRRDGLAIRPRSDLVSLITDGGQGPGRQTTCAEGDLASNPNVRWRDWRAAGEGHQTAYKQKDPSAFSWLCPTRKGFCSASLSHCSASSTCARDWGIRTSISTRLRASFSDTDRKAGVAARPLSIALRPPAARSLPTTTATRRTKSTSPNRTCMSSPGLLAACHSGTRASGRPGEGFEGAPPLPKWTVRKWREAYNRRCENYLRCGQDRAATTQQIISIIDRSRTVISIRTIISAGPPIPEFRSQGRANPAGRCSSKAAASDPAGPLLEGTTERREGRRACQTGPQAPRQLD